MIIDHIGIAVRGLEDRLALYRKLLSVDRTEVHDFPSEHIRLAAIRLGPTRIELMEPTGKEGAVAKFLEKQGEGIHHIAVRVENLDESMKSAQREGFMVIDKEPRKGALARRAVFIHPKSLGGVLLELVGD